MRRPVRTITLPPTRSRISRFGLPTSSAPSGVIVAALIPNPVSAIRAAASSQTRFSVARRFSRERSNRTNSSSIPSTSGSRTRSACSSSSCPVSSPSSTTILGAAMRADTNPERCSWCGAGVEADDGWRAYEPAGERRAVFCRLEHVVPWVLQDAHWDPGPLDEPEGLDQASLRCSHCGAELADVHVLLVRHRGEHRIADAFCSVEHMAEWAKAGGRWA